MATDYINHRISLAGGNADKLFESRAIQVIAGQASTPLAIGNLANRALIEAYKKGEARVLARFLERDTDPKVRQLKKVANV
jgi:type II secretory pathway predicted ATPase ExeA